MGRFERKPKDGAQDAGGRTASLVIQNGEVDDQTRAQLSDLGFDPDLFVGQMEAIERAAQAGAVPSETAPAEPPKEDFVRGLAKLKRLRDAGALSDDEFAEAKAKLLS